MSARPTTPPVPPAPVPLTFALRLGLANSLLIMVVCGVLSWVLPRLYLDHAAGELTERGRVVSEYLAREAARSHLENLHALEQQVRSQGGLAYIRFFDAQGLLIEAGGRTPVGVTVPPPMDDPGAHGPIEVGHDVWEFHAPIIRLEPLPPPTRRPSGARPGKKPSRYLGAVAIGVSLEPLASLRGRTFGTAMLVTSLFTLVAVLAAVRLARAITRPIGALAAAADAVARGDFSAQVEVKNRDEVGRLARSFNTMVMNLRRSATLEEKVRELQEVTRVKSEFLAAVPPELRPPLDGLAGSGEPAALNDDGTVPSDQAEVLEAIRRYSKLQLELINRVLDYSRIVPAGMGAHLEHFELAPMLEEILAIHRTRVGDRPVLLTVSVEPAVAKLETDRVKIQEIVRNFVDNAVKFTEAGVVSVKARPGASPDSVMIEVVDTGPGMAPEDLQTLFDAFQQEGADGMKRAGGLSTVKQLVDALGGAVTVASGLGEGSTFRVVIPCGVRADGDATPAAARSQAEAGEALDAVARMAEKLRQQAEDEAAGRGLRKAGVGRWPE
jgi:signal transduction histidine kinase